MTVRITLCGKVGVALAGKPMTEAGPGRLARVALAYLIYERRRAVSRDELAEVLWGDELPGSWSQMVRAAISDLRTVLRQSGLVANDVLSTISGGYQFRLPEGAVVDVEQAVQAVEEAEDALASGNTERAQKEAAEALEVAAAQFLPGGSGVWVERRQAEVRELHLRALEVTAAAALARNRFGEAIAAAERVVTIEPFRESAFVHLMAAHAGAGNRGEALRAYERCRRTLVEELGVSPSTSMEAAYMSLLTDERPPPGPGSVQAAALPLPGALAAAGDTFMVGRENESQRILGALERAGEARQAVLVGGEPGIGKTTLVAAVARRAHEQGVRVLYGRCDEQLGVAYQPFAEALGHYVTTCPLPELEAHVALHGGELGRITRALTRRVAETPSPSTTDPEADRYRLFEAVADVLARASAQGPVMLVLDDLHWAAAPTLLLLHHLLRLASPPGLVVVGTYRHTDVGDGHPLAEALADLRREKGVDRLALSGLDEDSVLALVEALGGDGVINDERGLARAVHVHTAGNPFFVGELLRHLRESGAVYRREGPWSYYSDAEGLGVPAGVREVVGRRLGRLSPVANRCLVWGSVIGNHFDLDLVEGVLEASEVPDALDGLEEGVDAHLLEEFGPGRYRFAHALVRDTIYSGITATRRARHHRRVGEALESLPEATRRAVLPALAHHFAEAAPAGCWSKAADYALDAARQSFEQAAWEDAVAHLNRALDVLDLADPPDLRRRCDVLLLLAESWTRFFDPPHAMAAARPAVEAAWALEDPVRMARAAYLFARNAGRDRRGDPWEDFAAARRICHEALRALGDGEPAAAARVMAALARIPRADAPWLFDADLTREALARARQTGDGEALGVALLGACSVLRGSPRLHEHLRLADELVTSRPAAHWDGWRDGHHQRALGRLAAGDRAGFEADVGACAQFGATHRFWWFRWVASLWQAGLALLDGRFDDVEPLAAAASVMAPQGEFFWRQMFVLRRERGDVAGALEAAGRLARTWPNVIHDSMVLVVGAQQDGGAGLLADLERFADQALPPMPPERVPVTLAYRAEVAISLGEAGRAMSIYDALLPWSGQIVVGGMGEGCQGAADRYLGTLAAAGGRWEDAEEHFRAAIALELGLQAPPLVARTRYWHGIALGEQGLTDQARTELGAAMAVASSLGMTALATQATAALGTYA